MGFDATWINCLYSELFLIILLPWKKRHLILPEDLKMKAIIVPTKKLSAYKKLNNAIGLT